MRLSLATRSLLGSVLIIALLGSVTTFAIVSMDRMRRQVSLMRRDLLPAGTSLRQLSRETKAYQAALKRNRDKDPGWARQTLTAYSPFPRTEKIATHLRRVGAAACPLRRAAGVLPGGLRHRINTKAGGGRFAWRHRGPGT